MALTKHQRVHVLAMRAEASDMPTIAERDRVVDEADDLLSGVTSWPADLREESAIHDWVEKPDERSDRVDARDG